MSKKILFLSLIVASMCMANINKVNISNYPLDINLISVSRGGTLPDNKAIKDGLGTILLLPANYKNSKKINNRSFNKVILKNKQLLKDNPNKSINDLFNDNMIIINNEETNNINNSIFINSDTHIILDGTACDDNNSMTSNDIYINGVCKGNCNLGYTYNNGVCIVNDGTRCDDGNINTSNDVYTNGVCAGTPFNNIVL